MFRIPSLVAGVAAIAMTGHAGEHRTDFHAVIDAAMSRMMSAMHVQPSGNVDRDFAEMMIAHHQGAIDMAVAQLRFGSDPKLMRIAQEIIVDQQQEIAAMKRAIGHPLPAEQPVPTLHYVRQEKN